jgi:hypothetical protein
MFILPGLNEIPAPASVVDAAECARAVASALTEHWREAGLTNASEANAVLGLPSRQWMRRHADIAADAPRLSLAGT